MLRRRKNSTGVHDDLGITYGGNVVMAKKKKPETWISIFLQCLALCFAVFLLYACYFHPSKLQFGVNWFYAHLGYDHAQHLVGQKYLRGYGVESNIDNALFWLNKAKDQGHAAASYDFAVAHLKGMNTAIDKQEAHRLLRHAAGQGFEMARETLHHFCSREDCGPLARKED